ncbi:UNVERIFIED_CONTAM: hypothetical protein GTU68_013245 [Idotea baltica]|nr:hypothetical protein [Idotea baltica]
MFSSLNKIVSLRTLSTVFYQRSNMSFCSWVKEEVYKDVFDAGIYVCKKCRQPLFGSVEKFNHDSPWPSFTNPIHKDSLHKRRESKFATKVVAKVPY